MLGRWPELPETEASGLGPLKEGFDLKGVMLCETPAARVNCSRSSTLVRPLAVLGGNKRLVSLKISKRGKN